MNFIKKIKIRNHVVKHIVPIVKAVNNNNCTDAHITMLGNIQSLFNSCTGGMDKIVDLARKEYQAGIKVKIPPMEAITMEMAFLFAYQFKREINKEVDINETVKEQFSSLADYWVSGTGRHLVDRFIPSQPVPQHCALMFSMMEERREAIYIPIENDPNEITEYNGTALMFVSPLVPKLYNDDMKAKLGVMPLIFLDAHAVLWNDFNKMYDNFLQ
jgi:hypothetical protein